MNAAVPPVPRTPSPRAKKLIYSYQGSQFVRLMVGVIFLVVGLPISCLFCVSLPGQLSLDSAHLTTTGTVVSTKVRRDIKVNNQHPTEIAFTFAGSDGKTYEGKSSTTDPVTLVAGESVRIEYVESDPTLSRVEGTTYGGFPVWIALTLLFPLIGLLVALGAVRENRREIRAFRDGAPLDGEITFVGLDLSAKINGRHPTKIEWTFESGGKSHKGSLSNMDPALFEGFGFGSKVTVLHDPDNPAVNTLWVD